MSRFVKSTFGVKSLSGNDYDGDTLKEVFPIVARVRGKVPETAFCDRGVRGRKRVGATSIVRPEIPLPAATEHAKRQARKNFGRRSAIEPVISHLKHDFRLTRNYLKGTICDAANLLLASAAFNCRKWMRVRPMG